MRKRGSMRSTGVGLRSQVGRDSNMEVEPQPDQERERLTGSGSAAKPDALAYITTVSVIVALATILGISFHDGITLFAFHPTLMAFGWLFFMTSALNAFSPGDITILMFPNISHQQRISRHWILQVCALICITLGFAIIVTNKIRMGKDHFTSLHGCFGLTSYILAIVTVFGGIAAKYSTKFKNVVSPIYTKLMHSSIGLLTYIVGTVTVILPFFSSWWNSENIARYPICLIFLCISISTILRPLIKLYLRISERVAYLNSTA